MLFSLHEPGSNMKEPARLQPAFQHLELGQSSCKACQLARAVSIQHELETSSKLVKPLCHSCMRPMSWGHGQAQYAPCASPMNALAPPNGSWAHATRPQVLLQAGGEDLVDERQGLPVVPEQVLPSPERAWLPKLPAQRQQMRRGHLRQALLRQAQTQDPPLEGL